MRVVGWMGGGQKRQRLGACWVGEAGCICTVKKQGDFLGHIAVLTFLVLH